MRIKTTRFGLVDIEADDVLTFSTGLVGWEDCHQWVLLADTENDALGWLQCTTRHEIALAVVSPRRFVPDYQFRIYRSELESLKLPRPQDAHVLVIVGKNERSLTLNLKAPIVIHLEKRLGRQVISNSELPLQYELGMPPATWKKSA